MKLTLTIVALLIFTMCNAQETIKIGTNVNLKLPAGGVKTTDLKEKARYMKVFESETLVNKMLGDHYTIGTMKLIINSGTNIKDADYLNVAKKRTDEINKVEKQADSYSYKKNVNGSQVLITYSNLGQRQSYRFRLLNKQYNNTIVSGSLKFNPADKDKALNIVEEILNSITFN